jgi:hypothetical protein
MIKYYAVTYKNIDLDYPKDTNSGIIGIFDNLVQAKKEERNAMKKLQIDTNYDSNDITVDLNEIIINKVYRIKYIKKYCNCCGLSLHMERDEYNDDRYCNTCKTKCNLCHKQMGLETTKDRWGNLECRDCRIKFLSKFKIKITI